MNWTKNLAIAATSICLAAGALSAHAQTLRLAVTDIVGLENLQREYAGFQKILSEKSGMKVELFPVPNRTAAVEALNAFDLEATRVEQRLHTLQDRHVLGPVEASPPGPLHRSNE